MSDSTHPMSRIAPWLTSLGTVTGAAGAYLWYVEQGEPMIAAALALAAVALVGGRAHLDGYDVAGAVRSSCSRAHTLSLPGTAEQRRAVGLSVLMVTSILAGVAFVGTQPVAESDSAVAQATHSNVSLVTGSYDSNVKLVQSDGTEEWSSSIGGSSRVFGTATDHNNDFTYAVGGGRIIQYDTTDGSEGFNVSIPDSYHYDPAVGPNNETVYVGSSGGKLLGISTANGSEVINHTVHSGRIYGVSPSMSGDVVYTASGDNTAKSIDPTDGSVNWETNVSGDILTGIVAGPNGDYVYVTSTVGDYVAQLDASTGEVIWQKSYSAQNGVFRPAIDKNGNVYIATDNNNIYKIDSDGNELWSNSISENIGDDPFPKYVYKDTLYLGTESGVVYDLDSTDGTLVTNFTPHSDQVRPAAPAFGGSVATSNQIDVRVTDQNGNPVENATVESYGVNTDALNDSVDDLEARSQELLDEAENPEPPSWNADLNVYDSLAADADTKYVTTHAAGDMGIAGWADSPDLQPAKLDFERGETVYAYVWDPSDGGLVQDGVESEYPGGVDDNTNVVVEQIDHKNDTISKTTYETDETYDVGGLGGEHDYVALNLPPGYYRIYAEGHPENAVVREVGDPASIIEQDLRNEAQKYSEQAQQVRDRINDGKFARQTVTTNESGYATIKPGSGVEILAIQAYKGDGSLVDAKDPDPSALRELRAGGFDGAIYLSTQPKRVNLNNFDTANETAQVEVRKWTATPYGNVTEFQNLAEKLQNQLLNETTADLETAFEDRLDEVNRDNLEQRWADLANLLRSNPDARERFLNQTDRDEIPFAEDLSDSELRKSLRVAQSALATQPSTGASGDTTTNVGDGVADFTAILTGQYEPDDIAVFAHYSNGSTRTVADEYVSVDQSLTGAQTEIQVNDYPVGEQDPAQVTFEVKAANSNGVDSVRDSIVNPAFGGEVPAIDAVDVSTLRPGPSETVSVSLRPSDDSSYGSLKDVRVFAPDGTELNATLDGERARFETAGQGTHTIRATYTDSTGAEFVETIRLNAQSATTNPPPTVRIEDGGDTVIAGSGLRSARVEETPDGKRVTAVVPGDGDRPGAVHVRGSDAFTGDVTVNVVQGDLEESVDKHVSVVVHTQLPEDALVYRDGRDQPITRDGSTQYGQVEERTGDDGSTKHIIRTYSDASGQLQLEVSRDPGFVERTLYDFRTSGVPLPSIGMLYNAVVIYDEVPEPPAVVTNTLEQPLLDEADPGEIVPGDTAAMMEVAT